MSMDTFKTMSRSSSGCGNGQEHRYWAVLSSALESTSCFLYVYFTGHCKTIA